MKDSIKSRQFLVIGLDWKTLPRCKFTLPGRTVVVDVVDGNASLAELIESPLAAGRVPVDVAHDGLLDLIVST